MQSPSAIIFLLSPSVTWIFFVQPE